MACPNDPEIERPKNFIEAISGDETWDRFGIRIKWTDPTVPGNIKFNTNEPVKLKLCVETKKEFEVVPECLSAWCWTHIKTKENPCAIWKEIKLTSNPRCSSKTEQGNSVYVFHGTVVPTKDDNYRLTFNVKYNKILIWANQFQVDNLLDVGKKPCVATQADQSPSTQWKNPLSSIMPQLNLSSLLCPDKKDQSQASPSQGVKRKKKTVECSDGEELEMLVKL